MSLNQDIRKTLTDPTPLYFAAGVIDKIREEAPGAFEAVRSTDPKEVQTKVSERAKDTQVRFNKALEGIDADIKKLREQTQSLAMQGLGYAAEYAVKAREAYDELAERGRGAVQTWRGEDAPEITVEHSSVRVAEPPKQDRASARGGRTAAGGSTGASSGTAKNTTARNTSASTAARKSSGSQSAGSQNSASRSSSTKSSTARSSAHTKSSSTGGAAKGTTGSSAKKNGGGSTPKSGS
ncbi:hypothetical protein [Streptomyces sp. TR02-1]|uniref:hypothetical protein n=1 Tax=Streptomyces sp. TR02-1 TaxID=3385977 RepID=UPI0039A3939F